MKTNSSFIILCLLCIFSSTNQIWGQPDDSNIRGEAQVKWSNPYEEPSNSDLQKIVATEGGGSMRCAFVKAELWGLVVSKLLLNITVIT